MNNKTKTVVGAILLAVALGVSVIGVIAQGTINTTHGDIRNSSAMGTVTQNAISATPEKLPQGKQVDLIKSTIEKGWQLRLTAGLDKNRNQDADFKNRLSQYYSATPLNMASAADSVADSSADTIIQSSSQLPPEKQGRATVIEPFQFASANAPELTKEVNAIDYGRYNEKIANFIVKDFGIDSITYQKIKIDGTKAAVVMDIKYWSKFVHTNPDGSQVTSTPHSGERHTFLLALESSGWRITSDTFEVMSGFEP
jgi:hypothetical protein